MPGFFGFVAKFLGKGKGKGVPQKSAIKKWDIRARQTNLTSKKKPDKISVRPRKS
jgi:hypothetical protein